MSSTVHAMTSRAKSPQTHSRPQNAAASLLPSGGNTLPKQTQTAMRTRFGHDFSQVRVHTDSRAGETAEALGANAFTLGRDIVFGPGRYAPGSAAGDRLVAHELTHIVQQDRWGVPSADRPLSRRGDASEQEADTLADRVASGHSVDVMSAPGAMIARDEADDGAGSADDGAGAALGADMAGAALGADMGDALGPAEGPPADGDSLSLQQQMGDTNTMMQAMSGMLQTQNDTSMSVAQNVGI